MKTESGPVPCTAGDKPIFERSEKPERTLRIVCMKMKRRRSVLYSIYALNGLIEGTILIWVMVGQVSS